MSAPAKRAPLPRFIPQRVKPGHIVQNTGLSRLTNGEWSIMQADGSLKPWRK